MSNAKLVWVTPNAEEMIVKMARVSAPSNQGNMDTAPRLLKYLINHKHHSPFEMANLCVEIETTRGISAQILRHRSFSFQEFSQRYADVGELGSSVIPHLRRQDLKNRQNSTTDALAICLKMQNICTARWLAVVLPRNVHVLYFLLQPRQRCI
jgi:thymidylate synthase (FAD)